MTHTHISLCSFIFRIVVKKKIPRTFQPSLIPNASNIAVLGLQIRSNVKPSSQYEMIWATAERESPKRGGYHGWMAGYTHHFHSGDLALHDFSCNQKSLIFSKSLTTSFLFPNQSDISFQPHVSLQEGFAHGTETPKVTVPFARGWDAKGHDKWRCYLMT